ncbi:hypothetical protein BDZ94DRAFT_1260731 [Collybia nuda]|uniref:Uncharacterized protein n=1 Tax=Collybia nuda TaxID=64659 RepID=A0A9P5Y5C6_9AGAR|nr:hypothetical protein BDZ94DRAFT_1260731 [Collybia nuda]
MFNNNEFRRSTRHTGRDFNLYGLDPEGRKTHLVMHMYGPWKPPTIPLVRFSGQSRPPPRFGPPSSEQLAWLPATFVQRDPPTYYGTPCLPYLPPPLTFDYTRFDALIPKPRGRIDNGTERTQPLVERSIVWSLTVMYTVGGGLHAYLQLWRTSSELGYRVRKDGTLGRLGKLRNGSDWRKAMKRFGVIQACL